jgi:glycosyltransferase involved in cell wall biosynthesis
MTKISVVIPTRNRPLQLHRALQSIYNQTVKPDEIIIIDDASSLTIQPKLAKLSISNSSVKIRLERFEVPQGASKARNKGTEIASGDILMFLDDDDTWEATKIRDQLLLFDRDPNIGLVYSGRLVVKENNREQILYKIKPQAAGNIYPYILYENWIGVTSSVAIKKSIFQEVGCFDEEMPCRQDYDLWIRCCKKTSVAHDNSCNVRYTISENPNTQISGQIDRHIKAFYRLCDKYSIEIKSQGILGSARIRASLLLSVAKSLRRHGLLHALPWIFRSFLNYPNLKVLGLILPDRTANAIRNLVLK